jgi:outer membrane receptor protein involved in Fe transport
MLSILLVLSLFSELTGKIQGIVIDEATNQPVPYANVIVTETHSGTATDEDGTFFILNVQPDIYTVEISCVGYETKQIQDVIVEINQTARLRIMLRQSPIEIEPITVVYETPDVKKDWTSTTYIITKEEISALPIDYAAYMIQFQPSVARLDTALHVRGGRATEVSYMIDNVSIIDPQTGAPAINISKGIIDEVIFMPGGFDAEYGRAMSGIINLISERPSDRFKADVYGKAETDLFDNYSFGYKNYQSSIHIPVSKTFKGLVSFDLMSTADWNPRIRILPHKERDDYTLYGKFLFVPSGKLQLSLSTVKSRVQFDRYDLKWKYNLDHYRSDLRNGDLEVINVNFLPDSRKLFNLTLSRLCAKTMIGVREEDDYGPFEDFTFRDYHDLQYPEFTTRNPFGANWFRGLPYILRLYDYPIIEGEGPEYQDKTSQVWKAKINTNIQTHKYHEIRAGFEYAYQDLENFIHFVPYKYMYSLDTARLIDQYHFYPKEYALFLQDNIDVRNAYAKVGLRVERFETGIEESDAKTVISPRLAFSVMMTDRFLFRSNIGLYAQPPLYDHVYQYYNLIPLPYYLYRWLPLVGNPDLAPEKTMAYEIGFQGKIHRNLSTTINIFYKDVYDLVGTRFVRGYPRDYVRYQNIEIANIKGCEAIVELQNSFFTGKISYTLSWARGTSSYAEEVYDLYNWLESYDTLTYFAQEYYLDFDQRHRIFIQSISKLPLEVKFYLFGYLGVGFPYTPPGAEGQTEERNALRHEFQRQFDCAITKSFRIGMLKLNMSLEVINIFNTIYQIKEYGPLIPLEYIDITDFHSDTFNFQNRRGYVPGADMNHDGWLFPEEQMEAFRALAADMEDSINAYSAPRKIRAGLSITF